MNTTVIIILIGLFAGILSGAVGVGGGIIMVPAMVYFLKLDQHLAQGTSLFLLAMPVVAPAVYNYWNKGQVDWKIALLMAVGFVFGSFMGSKLALMLPADSMKKIFGCIMLLAALKLIFGK